MKSPNTDIKRKVRKRCWYCNDDVTGAVLRCDCPGNSRTAEKREAQSEVEEGILEVSRARIMAKLAEKRAAKPARSKLTPEPRYDDVFFNGIEWMSTL